MSPDVKFSSMSGGDLYSGSVYLPQTGDAIWGSRRWFHSPICTWRHTKGRKGLDLDEDVWLCLIDEVQKAPQGAFSVWWFWWVEQVVQRVRLAGQKHFSGLFVVRAVAQAVLHACGFFGVTFGACARPFYSVPVDLPGRNANGIR